MKRLFFILCHFALFIQLTYAQKELVISGGNSVSSFVCPNGKPYVWGLNTNALGTGILGVGSTATQISTPTAVPIPGGLTIQQINCGSGSHFLALDCNGGVFGWGNNEFGQVGNNTKGNIVTVATRIRAGILSGNSNFDDGTGNLVRGVSAVYAGNLNSFAILNDGRLISWGANDAAGSSSQYDDINGQLGDGTAFSKLTPVFVRTSNGQPLTGVTQVYTGDNAAYALVDQDGDGIGTVYSWGNGLNGALGRNAGGTFNPLSVATVQDSYARPAYYANGTQMNNIISISASDVFGMALDMDGYVWTWGLGSWNNATGNTTVNYSGSDPRRVLAGNTTGASNDGIYLLASSIGGGQGYGMAVTADHKPVAWGGQGLTQYGVDPICSVGGLTGTGITTAAVPTSYIKRGTTIDNDVISINRGDTWGYYQRADGFFYTWGCNIYGQLGIGNTTNQATAVAITPVTGCSFKDPKPTANITPGDTTLCGSKLTSDGLALNAGFMVSAALAPSYTVTWTKLPSTVLKTGIASVVNLRYTAMTAGTYRVTIKYIGFNGDCIGYPDAVDEMTISTYPQTFGVPSFQTSPRRQAYCLDTAYVGATPNGSASTSAVYSYYATSTSLIKLGTSTSSDIERIFVPNTVSNKGLGNITLYAEESSYTSGTVLTKNQGCNANWNVYDPLSMNSNILSQSGFTTKEDNVIITSLNARLRSDVYGGAGNTHSATINFGIYGSTLDQNGFLMANINTLIGSFTYNYSRTRGLATDVQTIDEDVIIPVNIRLPRAGTYFISHKNNALTSVTGTGNLAIGRGNCGQAIPVISSPNLIAYTHNSLAFQNGQTGSSLTQGHFFNVNFNASQHFCDRIPVNIAQSCVITGEEENAETSTITNISPNPFKDQFLLETKGADKVLVFNSNGVLMEQQSLTGNSKVYLGQDWPKGFYLVRLIGKGSSTVHKVIKEE